MQDDRRYPLRIRFWYFVHDKVEAFWHWVWRAKLQPWVFSNQGNPIPPSYTLVAEHDATDDEKARGVVKHLIYKGPASAPPPPIKGDYSYKVSLVPYDPNSPWNQADPASARQAATSSSAS